MIFKKNKLVVTIFLIIAVISIGGYFSIKNISDKI